MRRSLAPSDFDAMMKSLVRSDSVSLLTRRAVPVQPVRPMTKMINHSDDP
ncbi:hypothetical protein ES703_30583 [subsurface metagenome]